MAEVYVYAELLVHIRQLSLYVTISEANSTSTNSKQTGTDSAVSPECKSQAQAQAQAQIKLLLSPNQERLLAVHESGQYARIYLPCKVGGAVGIQIAASTRGRTEFSTRLTIADTGGLDNVIRQREEGIEAPWSAGDLEGCAGGVNGHASGAGRPELRCKQCRQVIVHGYKIKQWKDLPSENWADLMDLWFCHKPHTHGAEQHEAGDQKGFGAKSKLHLTNGVGLVDVLSLLVHREDCSNVKVSSQDCSSASMECNATEVVLCKDCDAFLGTVSGDGDGGEDNGGYRLFKSSVSVQSQSYGAAVLIGPQLLHLIQNNISRRVVIHSATSTSSKAPKIRKGSNGNTEGVEGILAWVFIPDIYYYTSSSSSSSFQANPGPPSGFVRAIKLLYKVINNPLDLVDAPTSTVEELVLPAVVYAEFKASLEASAEILPRSGRRFKMGLDEWKVGLVERWERRASGRAMQTRADAETKADMDEGAEGWKDLMADITATTTASTTATTSTI